MPSLCPVYGPAVASAGFIRGPVESSGRSALVVAAPGGVARQKSAGQGEPGRRGGVVSGSGGGWTFDPVMGEHLLGVFP